MGLPIFWDDRVGRFQKMHIPNFQDARIVMAIPTCLNSRLPGYLEMATNPQTTKLRSGLSSVLQLVLLLSAGDIESNLGPKQWSALNLLLLGNEATVQSLWTLASY